METLKDQPAGFRQTFVLKPHRSLSPRGFAVLMTVYGLINFLMGAYCYDAGAWPVLGFCILNMLLVYVAFRLNYRAALERETIELSSSELSVTSRDVRGRQRRSVFNPYWVRVELTELAGDVAELRLTSKGKSLIIGRFLSDPERRDLAVTLRSAIASPLT
jgi:uncharacterized membrane protein